MYSIKEIMHQNWFFNHHETINPNDDHYQKLFETGHGLFFWMRLDAVTENGYCWLNQDFAEKALENFTYVQKENGRIPLWGHDRVGDLDEQLSAIPVIFDTARRICRRTKDKKYIEKIYNMLSAYMEWWLSPIKRDSRTGLVCGINDFQRQLC